MANFIDKILSLFSTDMGIDLGTANTLVCVQGEGIIISEPSVVAVKKGTNQVLLNGNAVGDVAKHILRLAGIKDAWGFTSGKTRTTVNYAKAAFEALKKISEMRVMPEQEQRLHIHTGDIGVKEGGEDE